MVVTKHLLKTAEKQVHQTAAGEHQLRTPTTMPQYNDALHCIPSAPDKPQQTKRPPTQCPRNPNNVRDQAQDER